ncbi:DNA polymerase I [Fangia hongkongensis]|uniref:DNA polymerase I n=1 Tax=Fangia hongkongensis TaxID=270495 RepID=UPI000374E850|nr:DNA polymerase I [Fangia hongkongensis]MBK2126216.1 DNA polymerase I [Fangia hongkongensis]
MSETKKIVLVDGSSYLFRAFHALPQLTNSQGEPTGAIFGVINMLKKLPAELDTEYVTVVFDAKGKNFRHELYPEYKAHRKPMADELRTQIEPLYELVEKLGFPLIKVEGVEADDVIGTLACNLAKEGYSVVISTGDKDMAQLVNDQVTLIDTMKKEHTDKENVIRKFGVQPNQIIDYLALMGDVSDNIPGVPKVGPKTAVKWLSEYHSLEGVMANADKITGKVGENLRDSLEILPLSYKLATIKCDLDLPYTIDDLKCRKMDYTYVADAFSRYDFRALLKNLQKAEANKSNVVPIHSKQTVQYEIIFDMAKFDALCQELEQSKLIAFDTETNSLDTFSADIIGLSFSLKPHHGVYIPLRHDYEGAPEQLDFDTVITKMKPIFENSKIEKIAQNAKFDMKVLSRAGIEVKGVKYDTMLESYIYDAQATRHDMDSLAKKYLNIDPVSFESLAGKGKKQLTFNQIEIEKAGFYAAEDADITYQLHQYFWPKIAEIPALEKLYLEEELPVCFVIDKMERMGVKIDSELLKEQSKILGKEIKALEESCHELAEESFNLSSPKQLREILFDKMELPVIKKTPGGQASTAEEVLQELSEVYELPQLLMEHRHLTKLKSTYTDKLPEMVNPITKRVHTSYHQAVASTGRLSSSDPNLQNIPVRSKAGRKIREAFIAREGYKVVALDYSQVELRIMAHLSEDENLLKAFNQGLDIHQATAAETLGIKPEEVSSEQRRRAKAINFGLIYGMGAFGLAKQLKIPRSEAQEYIDIYFSRYPGVKRFMNEAKEYAEKYGFVETIFGRRLYLPDIRSRNMAKRRGAERVAINAPMQGSAADIIKRAMILIDDWITKGKIPANMIMQVHDELVFEVKESELDNINNELKKWMESAALLKVPLIVDIGVGNNWEEAH